MKNHIENLKIKTSKDIQFLDITKDVIEIFKRSGIKEGFVNVYTPHSTCSVKINEWEEKLLEDMDIYLREFAPKSGRYSHNKCTVDGRANGHSHLMGLLLNTSETIPVHNGEPLLGKWQTVFFIELDGPRDERAIYVQVIGE